MPVDKREYFYRCALEAYREERRELSETWSGLEAKGHGVCATAGIFLAAAFSWSTSPPPSFEYWEARAFVASIALLICSIIVTLLSLWVRPVTIVPNGETTEQMAIDVLSNSRRPELPERRVCFISDQNKVWKRSNQELRKSVRNKGLFLALGQTSLVISSLPIAWLTALSALQK